jgi:hypothetical protein
MAPTIKRPTRKPEPPIADGGLWLAVLTSLLHARKLTAAKIRAQLGAIPPGQPESVRVATAIERLLSFPLDAKLLAAVESIDFDGGNEIYYVIERELDIDTGGESSYYDVHSIAGIGALTSLAEAELYGHDSRGPGLDLSPLADHPSITTLSLGGRLTGAAALERLPALKSLELEYAKLDDQRVVARLRRRGVAISR